MTDLDDPKSLSRERFARYAQGYVTSRDHAQGSDLDRLLEIAQPQPGWVVLDVATGGGHTALQFAPHVARVVASDLTPEMLAAAQAHVTAQGATNVTFRLADAEALPFEEATFDLVTCRIAPHHFADAPHFVRESARVLKPGGSLIIQDHLRPDGEETARYVEAMEKLRDPSHNRAYSEPEWRAMFRQAGLTVTHVERLIRRHAFLPWAERQGCTPDVIARLGELLAHAPASAAAWLQPEQLGTPEATFANPHLIIAGQKGPEQKA
jgi:ubiquinone/menaquinone biosynthesis C-methylase UbiE